MDKYKVMMSGKRKPKSCGENSAPTVTTFIANAICTLPKLNPALNGEKPAGHSLNQLWHCQ
jgi:hypothetical protein